MNTETAKNIDRLAKIADAVMLERGLEPDFSKDVEVELQGIHQAAVEENPAIKDLTHLAWCSIDNDDSLDLDQLTVVEQLEYRNIKVYVAVADVDAVVKKHSAIDDHACINTTSVFTSAKVFPMLPTKLSNDLTSLNHLQERLALVTEMVINTEGIVLESMIYRARVVNQAKLAYDSVSAWMDGDAEIPIEVKKVIGLDEKLKLHDVAAQRLRKKRHKEGALEFETFQPKAIFENGRVIDIRQQVQNRARQIIEEFMIATNSCIAQFLADHGGSSLRRIVRSPERWARICELVNTYGTRLPRQPDSKALEKFLAIQRQADPLRFPDLSLIIIKLMGAGEYVVQTGGELPLGHFGLAVQEYTHSTAPNRRYPDLITLRMVKAILAQKPDAYSKQELEELAQHCTEQEDASRKVERRVRKSEAALYLTPLLGSKFSAIVSGMNNNGTWVRIFTPPAEGMLIHEGTHLEVGDKLEVKLVNADVDQGFIDFVRVR